MIFWTPLHGHTKVGINIIVRAIHVLLEQFFFRLTELPSGVNLSYSYPIPHVPDSCLLLILLVSRLVRTRLLSYSYYLYPPVLLVSLGSGIIVSPRSALRTTLAVADDTCNIPRGQQNTTSIPTAPAPPDSRSGVIINSEIA